MILYNVWNNMILDKMSLSANGVICSSTFQQSVMSAKMWWRSWVSLLHTARHKLLY